MTNDNESEKNIGVLWETPVSRSVAVFCANVTVNETRRLEFHLIQQTSQNLLRFFRVSCDYWSGVNLSEEGSAYYPESYFRFRNQTPSYTLKILNSDWTKSTIILGNRGGLLALDGSLKSEHYLIDVGAGMIEINSPLEPTFTRISGEQAIELNLLNGFTFPGTEIE